jgi:hypothetical protein
VGRENSHGRATQLVFNVFCYLKREADNSGSVQAVAKLEKRPVNVCDVEKFAASRIYICLFPRYKPSSTCRLVCRPD